jgi:hypothetical protein
VLGQTRERLRLCHQRHRGERHGDEEVRELLEHDRLRRRGERPAQRVEVEHQEHRRQRDAPCLAREREHERRERRRQAQRACPGALLDPVPPQVRDHRQQQEQERQHIPPLRDPRDRLHAQRMQREEQSARGGGTDPDPRWTSRARPRPSQHEQEQLERQHRVRRVQQHVHEVIAARLHAEQRMVDRVRHPRERLVIAHAHGPERLEEHPVEMRPGKPPVGGVLEEVRLVVPVEEAAIQGGQEAEEGHRRDDQHRDRDLPSGRALAVRIHPGDSARRRPTASSGLRTT